MKRNNYYSDKKALAANQNTKERDYWINKLSGSPVKSNIPPDYEKKHENQRTRDNVNFKLTGQLFSTLMKVCNRSDQALHMLLVTGIIILLNKYLRNTDIIIGMPIYQQDLEIDFINTVVPLRNQIKDKMTVKELILQVKQTTIEAISNQNYPIEILPEDLNIPVSGDDFPLFDIVILLENIHHKKYLQPLHPNIIFSFSRKSEYIGGVLEYNSRLYKKTTSQRIIAHLTHLLENALSNMDAQLIDIEILSGEEKKQLLYSFNNTQTDYPANKTLPQLFEEQVERIPHHVAVIGKHPQPVIRNPKHMQRTDIQNSKKEGTKGPTPLYITYRELNEKSAQLANRLRSKGVEADSLVGLMVERSPEMIIGLWGILKAHGAFLPIDPEYPDHRIQYMLSDSNVRNIVIKSNKFSHFLITNGAAALFIDGPTAPSTSPQSPNLYPRSPVQPHLSSRYAPVTSLAYAIYTSGSTGRPKGVMIQTRSVVNRLNWMQRSYPISHRDVILQKTTFVFDVSVWELCWWALNGASVCLLEPGAEKNPEKIIDAIEKNQITTMHFVPSMLNAFLEYIEGFISLKKLASLKQVFASGEALKAHHAEKFNKLLNKSNGTRLINLYGPTEATVDVSYFNCTPGIVEKEKIIPIGKPIDNIHLYIINQNMMLAPLGVPGELYISGIGLARGYLNQPELTAEKFCLRWPGGRFLKKLPREASGRPRKNFLLLLISQYPNTPLPHYPIYKTGDLARWLPDGNIQFLGRKDHQVKLRGFRIELGEIENQLLKLEGIKEAVVLTKGEEDESKFLCAYIISGKEYETPTLKDFLSKELPGYMIPRYFVKLEQIPLLPNGKIDRSRFPAPTGPGLPGAFTAAGTPEEITLAELWTQVLKVDRVGIHDNFFALGGDSINSIQVVARAREKGLFFLAHQLFQYPTISGLIENVKNLKGTDKPPGTIRNLQPFSLISSEDRNKIPGNVEDAYPLTMLQAGLIFQSELLHGTSMYHDIVSYTLKGPFDRRLFQEAVERLVKHHPIFRTTYDLHNYSQYLQLVHKKLPTPLQIEDLRGVPPGKQKEIITASVEKEKNQHFDWGKPGLMRFIIHILEDETYLYTFSFHDSALDGWSLSSLHTELLLTYHSLLNGKEPSREPSNQYQLSFRDFVALERETIASKEAKQFWHELLTGSTFTRLPRWPIAHQDGNAVKVIIYPVHLPPGLSGKLKELAKSLHVPLKSVLLAAHCRVLAALCGNTDILTGYEHSGRPEEKGGEKILGLFLNTLPFRLNLKGESWIELIRKTYKSEIDFLPYRRYPMALIKQERKGQPLFETVFNFVHFRVLKALQKLEHIDLLGANAVAVTEFILRAEFGQNPFTDDVTFALHYHANVFGKEQIKSIGNYYVKALQLMSANPRRRFEYQSILPEAEQKKLLEEFNNTNTDYPHQKCFHQLFESQVQCTPGTIAVVCKEKQLSYGKLDQQANRLGRALVKRGVTRETLVTVIMERSIVLLTTILAIFKAGGVYLPLDPHSPGERIEKILDQSGCTLILTGNELTSAADLANPPNIRVFPVERLFQSEEKEENISPCTAPQDLAYVIYTSGSTGLPKGVMIEHRGMLNHLYAKRSDLRLTHGDIIAQNASQCFDISIWQFLAALLVGGQTVIYSNNLIMEPHQFISRLVKDQVTILEVVPSYLSILLATIALKLTRFKTLKCLLVTGEILKPELVAQWFETYPGIRMVNAYGPTEASDDITHHTMSKAPDIERIPIGKPLQNLRISIVDQYMQLCPLGVKGEICVSGIGVGRGYLNDQTRTQQVFMQGLYKTGDLGCWLPDGNIDFFGRKDEQVKIRGFRIELGEIENQLLKHKRIKETAVTAQNGKKGDKYLCAYIVTDETLAISEVKEYLSKNLPDYMIPMYFIKLREMPLTRTGKIDKTRLPKPDENMNTHVEYTPPGNELERKIVKIWSQVLEISEQKIGIYDNFFDLGGHSLKAMDVMIKSGGEFSLINIFQNPTPKNLAESIINNEEPDANQLFYKLTRNHKNEDLSLICFPYAGGNAVIYKPLADALSQLTDKMALYALELPGHNFAHPGIALKNIDEIASDCIGEIKNNIKTPIILWGHCSGTALTLEVAKLLEQGGFDLKYVCLGGKIIRSPYQERKRSVISSLQSLFRIEKKMKMTDEDIRRWLIDITGFTEFQEAGEQETKFIIRNFRHDAASANQFFEKSFKSKHPKKLNTSIYNIIAKDDPLTKDYEENYKNWERFSSSLELIVLNKGAHYFVKTEAHEIAGIIVNLWKRHN